MRKRFFSPIALCIGLAAALLLPGCEIFLGESENANVALDLSEFFGENGSRAVTAPTGIAFTAIHVSVFGPGMSHMTKTVSPGARYLNLYVPPGPDRRFKIEAFFTVTDPQTYLYGHLRSYIGRA